MASPRRYVAKAANIVGGEVGADNLSAVGPALVNVSAAAPPNLGDVLTATGPGNANWQALPVPPPSGIVDDPTVRTSGFTASANTRYFIGTGSTFTVYFPATPSDGDIVSFVGIGGYSFDYIQFDGNGLLIRLVPPGLGLSSGVQCQIQNMDVSWRYTSSSGFWEPLVTSVSSLELGGATYNSVVTLDGFRRPEAIRLLSIDSMGVGRSAGGSVQEMLQWNTAHNLYKGVFTPPVLQDSSTGLQNPWCFWGQWPRCHTVRWTGASDLIVRGVYRDGSGENKQDKLVINDTGSLGTGAYRNIIWKKEDTGATANYRIQFEAAAPSTDFADYVQPPGTSILIRWHEYQDRWLLTPMVPSGMIDRGVTTTNNTATTIHTHTTNSNSRLIMYKVQVEALLTSGTTVGDSALFDVSALFFRNSVGTVTQKDVTFVNGPYKDAGAAAWDVTFNISGSDIQMQVTGDSGDTIRWRVVGQITEHG